MKNVVSCEWLRDNLKNDDLVIVDCRFSLMDKEYGKRSYNKSHIKGAIRIDIEKQLSDPVSLHGGRHPIPSVERLQKVFQNSGINNNSIVVAYDEGDLSGPSRLWWILKYLGHKEVYVLNGGIDVFVEVGGEINTKEIIPKKGDFIANPQENMRVDMKYVKERLNNKDVAIVDCREHDRYLGKIEPVDKKAGHIPGALNYFWMDIFNKDGKHLTLKDDNLLKEHFKELNNYKEVIIHCGSGITASPVSLALTEADIPFKFYTGSFSDWISYDENQVDSI